jgi:hypothetical protein
MTNEKKKTCEENNIKNDMLPTGAVFKKTESQIDPKEYTGYHPQQNNGNCIYDQDQKASCIIFHSHAIKVINNNQRIRNL